MTLVQKVTMAPWAPEVEPPSVRIVIYIAQNSVHSNVRDFGVADRSCLVMLYRFSAVAGIRSSPPKPESLSCPHPAVSLTGQAEDALSCGSD